MPLNPEFKAKTLSALRSGEYEQARGMIGNFNVKRLCCIGVAAHSNGLADADTTGEAATFIGLTGDESSSWMEWNDEQGLTFPEIADRIEAEY